MPTKHLWSDGLKEGVKACWSGCAGSREAEDMEVHRPPRRASRRRELRTTLREGREEVLQQQSPERQHREKGERSQDDLDIESGQWDKRLKKHQIG